VTLIYDILSLLAAILIAGGSVAALVVALYKGPWQGQRLLGSIISWGLSVLLVGTLVRFSLLRTFLEVVFAAVVLGLRTLLKWEAAREAGPR
jgi:FtsH-binding integral membrane protein